MNDPFGIVPLLDINRPIFVESKHRPWKLDAELAERICLLIAQGVPIRAVCIGNKISETTYRRWLKIGAKAKTGIHRDFWLGVQEAEAFAEATWTAKYMQLISQGTVTEYEETVVDVDGQESTRKHVKKVGAGDAKGVLSYLERRFPRTWADPDSVWRRQEAEDAEEQEDIEKVVFEFRHTSPRDKQEQEADE